MKKFLLLFIAVVLSFAFAVSASAEDVLDAKLNGFYAYISYPFNKIYMSKHLKPTAFNCSVNNLYAIL